jgi:hypothetical protein
MHCEGSNGGTTFTDSGPLGLTCTAVGATTTSTGQARAGTTAAFNNFSSVNTSRISVSNNAGLNIGSGDFTMEASLWFVGAQHASDASPEMFSKTGATAGTYNYFWRCTNGNFYFYWSTNGTAIAEQHVAFTPSTGQWYDLATSRVGTNLYFMVNGVQQGTTQTMNVTVHNTADVATIFASPAFTGYSYNGYLDEIRVTKGVGRYNGTTYTPTFPFPDS